MDLCVSAARTCVQIGRKASHFDFGVFLMTTRATWKGSLHVSLLSVRVKAYASSTRQQQTVQLHQLHGDCQQRIRYQKVCPVHGPVESDQIVMGYEHAPEQHIPIDLNELDQLRSPHELRSIRIATQSSRQSRQQSVGDDGSFFNLRDLWKPNFGHVAQNVGLQTVKS